MADVKISQLPVASSPLSDGDAFPLVQGSTTTQATVAQVRALNAPVTASYLTLGADDTLQNERVFTPGTGLKGTDGGAGNPYTLGVDDQVVATLSGSTTFKGPVAFDPSGQPATAAGTDVWVHISGSAGLTGSNPERKAFLIDGAIFLSGSVQEQRPSLFPKSYSLNWRSGSVTTTSTPYVAFTWPVPSGSTAVDVKAWATTADVSIVGDFRVIATLKNQGGTVTQLGTVGGSSAGQVATGSAWGIAVDVANNMARLVLTGSNATVTWGWNLLSDSVTP